LLGLDPERVIINVPQALLNLPEYKSESDLESLDLVLKRRFLACTQRSETLVTMKSLLIEFDNSIQPCFYTIEIIHVLSFKWSGIKILVGEKLMATSHFINSNQLPSTEQQIHCNLTLDTDCEKAMLIRNLYGDFAIVKGKWKGLTKETSPRNSKKEIFDYSDSLNISIYFCKTKEILEMSIDDEFKFNLNHAGLNCEVDLKTGKIIVL
jgi:hypothetical protein